MSLPVDPSLHPLLRYFQRLRYALQRRSQTHINYYVDAILRELGEVRGPSEPLLIARNQLLRIAPGDLDARLLGTLECLVFGGLVPNDDSNETSIEAESHPLDGSVQWALKQLAPFLTPELCRSDKLIGEFLQRQSALLNALAFLQDALVLPPEALTQLSLTSAVSEVREWAQAVIDAA